MKREYELEIYLKGNSLPVGRLDKNGELVRTKYPHLDDASTERQISIVETILSQVMRGLISKDKLILIDRNGKKRHLPAKPIQRTSLPAEKREAILRMRRNGVLPTQIANQLGVKVGTVKSLLSRNKGVLSIENKEL